MQIRMKKNRYYPALRRKRKFIIMLLLFSCLLLSSCRTGSGQNPGPAVGNEAAAEAENSADPASAGTGIPGAAENASLDGTDLQNEPDGSPSAEESAEERTIDLSEAAGAVSEKNGVNILYGNDVPLTYKDYTAEALNDREKLAAALEELDNTLSIFPPEFFSSVKEGYCEAINICLAQNLQAINDSSYIENAYAFTTVQDDMVWLVLNADRPLERGLLIHELTHVIDYRLLGMQQLSEAEWNRLNPPSFSYYNAYLDDKGTDLRISGSEEYTAPAEEEIGRIWFCDAYSKTFAMEDRARLMEKLLENAAPASDQDHTDKPDRIFSSPHVQTKLRFYFYTLRQAFENSRWPEETVWEAELHRAIQ